MSRANIVEEARGNEVTKKGRSARRLAEELRREDEDQEEEKGEEEEEEEEEGEATRQRAESEQSIR